MGAENAEIDAEHDMIIAAPAIPKIGCFTTMRYLSLVVFWTLLICSLSTFATPNIELKRFEFKQYHMGVDVRIVLYAATEAKAVQAAGSAFRRIAQLDDIMSDYRASSELMMLCAKSGGPPTQVSAELFKALERSQEVSARSNGAFDVTCGPIIQLWRAARKAKTLPNPETLRAAIKITGWKNMILDRSRHSVQLSLKGMRLDLGGIGKGYAGDCAQEVLKQCGIRSALVEAGGDVVVSNSPPGKKGWIIRIDSAGKNSTGKNAAATDLAFANCAISTSGDAEQFVEIDGKRYSHIVDPHTGLGLTTRIAVTVVAKNGLTSDSLTKVVSVLGYEKALPILHQYPVWQVYTKLPSNSEPPR